MLKNGSSYIGSEEGHFDHTQKHKRRASDNQNLQDHNSNKEQRIETPKSGEGMNLLSKLKSNIQNISKSRRKKKTSSFSIASSNVVSLPAPSQPSVVASALINGSSAKKLDDFFSARDVEKNEGTKELFSNELKSLSGTNSIMTVGTLLNSLKGSKKEIPVYVGSTSKLDLDIYTPENEVSEEEAAIVRAELFSENFSFIGDDIPSPQPTWEGMGLTHGILRILQKQKFKEPFAIQSQSIPIILKGRNVVSVAPTGSGKTLAFVIPALMHARVGRRTAADSNASVLILLPSRELCEQVYDVMANFLEATHLRGALLVGGVDQRPQISTVAKGVDIIVATPGRLIDIVTKNNGRLTSLRDVCLCVLDEADQMFDRGFEKQMTMIFRGLHPHSQRVLFSATMSTPMEQLIHSYLTDHITVLCGQRLRVNPKIKQRVVYVGEEESKLDHVLKELGVFFYANPDKKAVVFCETIGEVDALFSAMLASGYDPVAVHAAMDQSDRSINMDAFRTTANILIATSVAGRGIDVPSIGFIINYDCPNHAEMYVHRVGRTGRGNRSGEAVTLITDADDRHTPFLIYMMNESDTAIDSSVQALYDKFVERVGDKHPSLKVAKRLRGRSFKFSKAKEDTSAMRREHQTEDDVVEHEIISTNDGFEGSIPVVELPVTVRRRLLNRGNLKQLEQAHGVSIRMRGVMDSKEDPLRIVLLSSVKLTLQAALNGVVSSIKDLLSGLSDEDKKSLRGAIC
ncbi:hypothetical protein PCE1_002061 [Barthelona sp. PCE]